MVMTVGELIQKLQAFPIDTEVMFERGEWGPCRSSNWPRLTLVYDKGTGENWEVFDGMLVDEEDKTVKVVLL